MTETKPLSPTMPGRPSAGARPCQMREAWGVCSVSDIALRSDPRLSCSGSVAMETTRVVRTGRQLPRGVEGCQSGNRIGEVPDLWEAGRAEGWLYQLSPGYSPGGIGVMGRAGSSAAVPGGPARFHGLPAGGEAALEGSVVAAAAGGDGNVRGGPPRPRNP